MLYFIHYQDTIYTDSKDKAAIIHYFTSVFISKDEGTDPCQLRVAVHFLIFHLIHNEGVTNLPSNLDDYKAIATDEISTTLLKDLL